MSFLKDAANLTKYAQTRKPHGRENQPTKPHLTFFIQARRLGRLGESGQLGLQRKSRIATSKTKQTTAAAPEKQPPHVMLFITWGGSIDTAAIRRRPFEATLYYWRHQRRLMFTLTVCAAESDSTRSTYVPDCETWLAACASAVAPVASYSATSTPLSV